MEPEFNPDIELSLSDMLAHAASHSPYYREQGWAKSLRGGARIALKNIPVTRKSLVREQTERFFSTFVPPSEGPVELKTTSGSTGQPMRVKWTTKAQRINIREDTRLAKGWGFETHLRILEIRNPSSEHPPGTMAEAAKKGKRYWSFHTVDSRAGLAAINETGASLLHTYPTMLLGILQEARDQGVSLPLKLVSTISEIVPEEVRSLIGRLEGCRHIDKYGSVETGIIASQCSSCRNYHPTDRQMKVEVLDDDDRPVRPGKLGKVVVTMLFNRAMPLVRYETGDYAVVAKSSDCPHASLSLQRISGREKNLFKMPDGRRVVPVLSAEPMLELGLRHFRMIQRGLTEIEFQYVPRDPAAEIPEGRIQKLVDESMVPGFRVSCVRVAELPRAPSGKFLMHESLV